MNRILPFILPLLSVMLTGCANDGTALRLGEIQHPPSDPKTIAILLEPPTKPHVVIGLVESQASTDDYLSKSRTQDAAVRILKEQAAKIGAHAVVLTAKGSRPYGQMAITTGSAVASGNTSSTANITTFGNSASVQSQGVSGLTGYYTSTTQSFGWELIQLGGTAVRYSE